MDANNGVRDAMTIALRNNAVIMEGGRAAMSCSCCEEECTLLCNDNPTTASISISAPSEEGNPWTEPYGDPDNQARFYIPSTPSYFYRPGDLEYWYWTSGGGHTSSPISFNAVNVSQTISLDDPRVRSVSGAVIYSDGVVTISGYRCQIIAIMYQRCNELSSINDYPELDLDAGTLGPPRPAFTAYACEDRGCEVIINLRTPRPTVKINTQWGGMWGGTEYNYNNLYKTWRPATNTTVACKYYDSLPLEEYAEGNPSLLKGSNYGVNIGVGTSRLFKTLPGSLPWPTPSDLQKRIASPVVATVAIG